MVKLVTNTVQLKQCFVAVKRSALVFVLIKHVSVTPLNRDTPIIPTLWHVPLVFVLMGLQCIIILG